MKEDNFSYEYQSSNREMTHKELLCVFQQVRADNSRLLNENRVLLSKLEGMKKTLATVAHIIEVLGRSE